MIQTTHPLASATIDILIRNSTIQTLKHAYFKYEVPAPAEHKAWYEDSENRKAMAKMIAIAMNTAAKKKKLLIN